MLPREKTVADQPGGERELVRAAIAGGGMTGAWGAKSVLSGQFPSIPGSAERIPG
jgi:hypothetical protein